MEELLLRHFLALEEMHVVHQQEVHVVAIATAELGHRPRVNRFDHVVDELLGAEVLQPRLRMFFEDRVRDRLHQMRLTESRRAVNEERVVRLPGRFADGMGGSGGQLVRFSDDERLKRIAFVERGGGDGGCRGGVARLFSRRDEEIHLRPALAFFLHAEHNSRRPAEHALGRARQQARVLRLVPFRRELIGRADDETSLVERDRFRWLEPCPDRRLGEFASRLIEETLPSFVD